MAFEPKVEVFGDIKAILTREAVRYREAATRAVNDTARELQAELRAQTLSGGLGQRVANAWRVKEYPGNGRSSFRAAALVETKADKIIDAFSAGKAIVPKAGAFLAIPTENVPRRGRKKMTWDEVQARYGQYLRLIPTRRGGYVQVLDLVRAKSGKGWRKASAKRLSSGRGTETVVMFILVRQVSPRRIFDLPAIEAKYDGVLAQRLLSAFGRLGD